MVLKYSSREHKISLNFSPGLIPEYLILIFGSIASANLLNFTEGIFWNKYFTYHSVKTIQNQALCLNVIQNLVMSLSVIGKYFVPFSFKLKK